VSPKLPVKVEVNLPRNQREYALMIFIKRQVIAFSIFHFWDWNLKSVQMLVKTIQHRCTQNFSLVEGGAEFFIFGWEADPEAVYNLYLSLKTML
jgi:hypothetical protein